MSHPDASVTAHSGPRAPAVVGLAALLGVIAGVVLGYLTDVVSKSDIRGDGWSLRGNGALIVPLVGFPAALATGWTMLGLWWRANYRWAVAGLSAGALTLFLGLLGGFAPNFYSLGPRAADIVTVLLVAGIPLFALVAGVMLAVLFARVTERGVIRGTVLCVLTAASGLVSWGGYLLIYLRMILVPVIVVLPLLGAARGGGEMRPGSAGWLVAGYVALPISLIVGLFAASRVHLP